MKTYMNDSRIENLSELAAIVKGLGKMELLVESIDERYALIEQTIEKFGYTHLPKRDKRTVLLYLRRLTGYKKAQLLRLIKKATSEGELLRTIYVRHNPNRLYGPQDIKLLEYTDAVHKRLNSLATKEILRRMVEVYHDTKYQLIAKVSASHINNLRRTPEYKATWVNGTKAVEREIGETKKPQPNGKPGSVRIDTVHQRDVYYIHAVCEITQWDIIVCVPMISERYLLPALVQILASFPFKIFNFHSDRGSEYVNRIVARLLNKLLIEQTKSRSRHSNDNALIESKNGSVIRKNFGYHHVNQDRVDDINSFLTNWFNPYLNYHRPCLYPTSERIDKHGKVRVTYAEAKVPYDKLRELAETQTIKLQPEVTWESMAAIAAQLSDNEFAKQMRQQEHHTFDTLTDIIARKEQ